ncbi:MAG: hypothetical protein JWQ25_1320 [Daejeonella sp.]|nr:hypothetical protein [Daejeonella sp.]
MLGFLGSLAILSSLDYYFKIISISAISENLFYSIASNPSYALTFIALGLAMFFINHNYLKSNLYLDELHAASEAKKSSTEIPFLSRFGELGDLVANELKLIFRNKRPKSALIMSFLFMFYGLIFYRNPEFANGYAAAIFCGMFMTGIFIINYGQFLFSWQSAHFDGILAHKMDVKNFFKAKFLLFTLFSTVAFFLTIPYVYFGIKILLIQFIMYLWNLGVNTLMVLYFANKNYKRIDLTKSASFNWEGVGATQWLLSIPLLVGPFVLYLPFYWLGYPNVGLGIIALTGVGFIISREYWLNKLVAEFNRSKYKIAEGFRNK